jgi:hypothetical protein
LGDRAQVDKSQGSDKVSEEHVVPVKCIISFNVRGFLSAL